MHNFIIWVSEFQESVFKRSQGSSFSGPPAPSHWGDGRVTSENPRWVDKRGTQGSWGSKRWIFRFTSRSGSYCNSGNSKSLWPWIRRLNSSEVVQVQNHSGDSLQTWISVSGTAETCLRGTVPFLKCPYNICKKGHEDFTRLFVETAKICFTHFLNLTQGLHGEPTNLSEDISDS